MNLFDWQPDPKCSHNTLCAVIKNDIEYAKHDGRVRTIWWEDGTWLRNPPIPPYFSGVVWDKRTTREDVLYIEKKYKASKPDHSRLVCIVYPGFKLPERKRLVGSKQWRMF